MSPHPLVLQGRQAFESGDLPAALSLAEMRLQGAPADSDALQLKAFALRARGDTAGAETVMRQAIRFDARSPWAHNDLTELLHADGRKKAAETAAREALVAHPEDAQAHLQLGVILGEKDDLPAAEFHNRRALALAGPHPQILVNLALTLYNQGRVAEAEPWLQQAHAAQPGDAMTMAHLSRVYEAKRDMAQAFLWLERAERAGQHTGEDFTLLRALYLGNAGREQEALNLIDRSPGAKGGPAQLDRARLLDKLGRHDEAWPAMVAAKAQLARDMGLGYDAGAVAAEFAALKRFFTRETLARLPCAAPRPHAPQPIFILGFPRSGTTLIEQMLASHPEVSAGGELPFVHEWQDVITQALPGDSPFSDRLAQAEAFDFHHLAGALRDHYLGRAEAYGLLRAATPFFTDKMPLNDVYLPLIRLAFPEAPVLRMIRHPLDVAVSMLSHNLTHGYNSGYHIDTVIAHMRAMQDLNAHYDDALDHPVLAVKYEDFVADQDGQTRRILSHIGLAFDPATLRFHDNRRHAPTPSYAQVTKPLNDRSVGRWKAYQKHLAPCMADIAPVVAALGYGL